MAEQISNPFGITFIDDEEVPEAPRKSSRNDALWVGVKVLLKDNPGKWAQVKVFNSATGAGQKAGQINNGHNKEFPNKEWEARYTTDKENDSSVLFLAYRVDSAE